MQKERIFWIDWAKAIGIYLVVLGHFDLSNKHIIGFIFMFHMALFFFISGFLASEKNMSLPWRLFVKYRLFSLLIPYFLYNMICAIWPTFLVILGRSFNYDELLVGSILGIPLKMFCGPSWFLLALFWCNILLRLNKIFVVTLFLMCIILLRFHFGKSFPGAIDTVPIAFLFFASGYYLKHYVICLMQWVVQHKIITGFSILISFYIVAIVYFMIGQQNLLLANVTDNPLLSIVTAYIAIYAIFALSVLLSKIKISFITQISTSTLFIMCIHMVVISFVSVVIDIQSNIIIALLFALILTCGLTVFTPIIRKYFPILMGNR